MYLWHTVQMWGRREEKKKEREEDSDIDIRCGVTDIERQTDKDIHQKRKTETQIT